MKHLIFALLLTASFLIGCGEDNIVNNGNNTSSETLIYSKDTLYLFTNQTGNFYVYRQLTIEFDTSYLPINTSRVEFSVLHNLDSTDSRGLVAWRDDSLSTNQLRGYHSFNLEDVGSGFNIFSVIYFSNSFNTKYLKLNDIKIYKLN